MRQSQSVSQSACPFVIGSFNFAFYVMRSSYSSRESWIVHLYIYLSTLSLILPWKLKCKKGQTFYPIEPRWEICTICPVKSIALMFKQAIMHLFLSRFIRPCVNRALKILQYNSIFCSWINLYFLLFLFYVRLSHQVHESYFIFSNPTERRKDGLKKRINKPRLNRWNDSDDAR